MRIKEVFKNRRSVYNFREDFKMNENDFRAIFELARYSPSIFNTQGTQYLVTMDKEKQLKLKEICHNQHKIYSASGVILVLSEKDYMEEERIEEIYRSSVSLGIMTQDDLDLLKHQIHSYSKNMSEEDKYLEMMRNAFINVGLLISICTILGLDTCPMNVQNKEQIRELFNIPDNLEILFMLPVGKGVETIRPRGIRKDVDELVQFEEFKK